MHQESNQLAISFDLHKPEFTSLARRRDPSTSIKAARKAEKFKVPHAKIIFNVLDWNRPMTAKEMPEKCHLTFHQVDRRMKELVTAGRIRWTGIERDGCREYEAIGGAA